MTFMRMNGPSTQAAPVIEEELSPSMGDNTLRIDIARRRAWTRSMEPTIRRSSLMGGQFIRTQIRRNIEIIDEHKIMLNDKFA